MKGYLRHLLSEQDATLLRVKDMVNRFLLIEETINYLSKEVQSVRKKTRLKLKWPTKAHFLYFCQWSKTCTSIHTSSKSYRKFLTATKVISKLHLMYLFLFSIPFHLQSSTLFLKLISTHKKHFLVSDSQESSNLFEEPLPLPIRVQWAQEITL